MAQETKLERAADRAAETVERHLGPTLDRGADAFDRFVAPAREVAKGMAGALGGPVGAWVAAGVDDVLGARGAILREQRLVALLREMHEALKAVDTSKLDLAFLGSLEWSALLEGGMLRAMRAWQEEKIRIFAQFLANAMKIGPGPGYRERMLNVVDTMTLGHVIALRAVASWTERPKTLDPYSANPLGWSSPRDGLRLEEAFPGLQHAEILGYLSDLRSLGLAEHHGHHPMVDHSGRNVAFPWTLATIQGFEVLDFISAPPAT